MEKERVKNIIAGIIMFIQGIILSGVFFLLIGLASFASKVSIQEKIFMVLIGIISFALFILSILLIFKGSSWRKFSSYLLLLLLMVLTYIFYFWYYLYAVTLIIWIFVLTPIFLIANRRIKIISGMLLLGIILYRVVLAGIYFLVNLY